jgi:glycerophosphoryl diester phosphodiesterase
MISSELLLAVTTRALSAAALLAPSAVQAAELRRDPAAVIKVAHRGGVEPGYPENTLRAYRRAIDLGADVIEIDLRATRDGAIVIIHDDSVDRTTNGRGKVAELSLATLRGLDAGQGERIPTLEEALKVVAPSRAKLLLDVKPSPSLDKVAVVRLLETRRQTLDVIIGVRSLDDLAEFRRLNRNLRTLAFLASAGDAESYIAAGADVIRLWPSWIEADPATVERIQKLGRAAWVTSVDDSPAALRRLVEAGVDGIIADRVQTVTSAVASLRPQSATP